jgi:hypothetical protein
MVHAPKKPILAAAAAALFALPQIAAAQSAAPLSGLYACEAIAQSDAQLACFRAETAKLRAAETTGDIVALEKETFAEIKKEEAKAAEKELTELKAAEEIRKNPPKQRSLAIQSAETYGANGYIRFTLENGEVWRQVESGRVRLSKGGGDVLTIKRKSLGSSLGRVNDKRPSFRIKRVE